MSGCFFVFITCHTTLYPINIHYLCSSKSYKSETEVISVEGLSVEFNATPLFEDVSYVINKKTVLHWSARMVQVNQQC